MTIKAIRDLDNLNPALKTRVIQRFESMPNFNDFIRYSFGELEKWSHHQAQFFLRWGENGVFKFREKFTTEELNIIDSFSKSKKPEFIERMKSRVKVGTDKTGRYIKDLVTVCRGEMQLQAQIDDLQTQRSEIGKPKVAE